jgi:transglutaminase-like putative cysteine protease
MEPIQKRWWDIWAVLFLIFTLWITTLRLELTGWTDYLNRVQLLVTIGYIFGVLLGASTFDKRVVRWLAAAYSMFFVPWQLASIIRGDPSWTLRIVSVWERSLDSLNLFLANRPATDVTLFLLIMSTLFWFLGLTSGYLLIRYAKPWVPLFLTGLTLFIIDFNDPALVSHNRFSGLFMLFVLMLLGRLYYLRSQRAWVEKGVAVEFETGFSFNRNMIVGGLLLVFTAWNVPVVFAAFTPGTPANQTFTERWNQFRERASNAFAGLESSVVYVYDFYQDSMSLGTGTGLGEQLFFTVRPSVLPNRYHFYWRGYSYDFYDGREWSNTVEGRGNIQPEDWPLPYSQYDARRQIEMEFKMQNVGMRPVYAPQVMWTVDRPVRYVVDDIGDGFIDLIGVVAEPSIQPRSEFTVTSQVVVPTVNQLRDAGIDYPEWTERYLQLPEEFPDSIRQLAEEIVGEESIPYFQTRMITQYLRDTIEYLEVIDEPPTDRDVIEWFLFEYKKGFCNYYATAQVLMLRSLGIPARIAVGFAQGTFNEEEKYFEIREKESHAWPEVYFPGIGWVEFEPTASLPMQEWIEISPIEQDQNSAIAPMFPDNRPMLDFEALDGRFDPDGSALSSGDDVLIPQEQNDTWAWLLAALVVSAVTGWIFFKRFPKWFAEPLPLKLERGFKTAGFNPPRILQLWARQMELHPIERMFTHVIWMLKLLGYGIDVGITPREQVQQLIAGIPDAREPASILLDQYQLAVFSRHPFDLTLARQAYIQLWRLVTPKAARRVVKWLPV